MFIDGLLETVKGIGAFFVNPLFYMFIVIALSLGLKRTKRERQHFHVRINDFASEVRHLLFSGIYIGLICSLVIIGVGITLPVGAVVLLGFCTILLMLSFQIKWLSPAYIVGLSILFALFLPEVSIGFPLLDQWLTDIHEVSLTNLGFLLAIMLFAEGFLILKRGHAQSSPHLVKSKRGKWIGVHESERLWMVPVFLVVPGNLFTSVFEWWPVFGVAGETYGLLLVPFGIGFYQRVQSMLPKKAISKTGTRVLQLSGVVTILAIASYWVPFLVVITAAVAIIGRELIVALQKMMDDDKESFFSARDRGIVILDILPKSPAQKMGLLVGEVIVKANGQTIHSEKDFYEALQTNRAFCKLEVLDYNGEVRFAQRSLYDGEHHELGVMFVKEQTELSGKVS